MKDQKGFTLIELLIVIAIIGFLAAAVLVAVDPVRRIQDSRDSRRFAEANAILNAVLTKQVDDRRIFAGSADAPLVTSPTYSQVIVTDATGINCDAATAGITNEVYPGCNQTLDLTATALAGTATNTGATVNMSTTGILATLSVGDTVVDAADGTDPCVVASITDDDTFVCTTTPTYSTATLVKIKKSCVVKIDGSITGTVNATTSSATLVGNGTLFLQQVRAADVLTMTNGSTCTVDSIASQTSLTCTASISQTAGDSIVNTTRGIVPTYIATLPFDPRGSGEIVCEPGSACSSDASTTTAATLGSGNTGYYLHRTSGNRLEIGACFGEQTTSINVKR